MNSQSVISLSRKRLRTATPLLAIVLLLSAVTAFAADTDVQPPKISGRIRYHENLKARPANVSLEQHKQNLRQHGVNAEKLDREEVAFYVTRPLTVEEVRSYEDRGIKIDTGNWVPPVPGRHAYGFYLAEVPYNRLEELEADGRVARIDSTEIQSKPQDHVARALTQVDAVQAGTGFSMPRTGTGVRIAIADSALDRTHPDLTNNPPFETYDMTTGTGTNNWSTNVAIHRPEHGTIISGIVAGSGINSGGLYRGVAPSAQWAFYKIGNNLGQSSPAEEVKAINRAVAADCQIFTMSYGGLRGFLDGSGATEQAIDVAVSSNVTVLIAAGNSAAAAVHDSLLAPPGANSEIFALNVGNDGTLQCSVTIQVLWRDNEANNANIVLSCTNLGPGESIGPMFSDTSPRNTKQRNFLLFGTVGIGQSKTYYLRLQNSAPSGVTPLVHCYAFPADLVSATFANPDPNYTVTSPAVADGAIAVGAHVHRNSWTNCSTQTVTSQEVLGTVGSFSGRGPRVDGLQKPDVSAPGAYMISLATPLEPQPGNTQIPNVPNTGCSYAAAEGTSVAAPHAAGIVALILQAQPGLTPADVRTLLTSTTTNAAAHNTIFGWGILNASNAVHFAEANLPGVWVNFPYAGTEEGNYSRPFNTVIEGVTNAPSAPPAIIPRIRIVAGNRTESIRITNGVRIESFGGPVRFGTP